MNNLPNDPGRGPPGEPGEPGDRGVGRPEVLSAQIHQLVRRLR